MAHHLPGRAGSRPSTGHRRPGATNEARGADAGIEHRPLGQLLIVAGLGFLKKHLAAVPHPLGLADMSFVQPAVYAGHHESGQGNDESRRCKYWVGIGREDALDGDDSRSERRARRRLKVNIQSINSLLFPGAKVLASCRLTSIRLDISYCQPTHGPFLQMAYWQLLKLRLKEIASTC